MALTPEQEISEIKNRIGSITDVGMLRSIRNFADKCVQDAKESAAKVNKAELEKKFLDKYLVIYGSHVTMMSSLPNKNDIKIVHVLDIDFQGNGFFRCHAKVVHIKFNDEWNQVAHLTSDWGSSYISYSDDTQYDVYEKNIDMIIDKAEADKIVADAKADYNKIVESWDI